MQKKIIALFWKYSEPYAWKRNTLLVNVMLVTLLGGFIGPLIISGIFNQLQSGTLTLASSGHIIIAYALCQLYAESFGWRFNLWLIWTFESAAQRDLYHDVFRKLEHESARFHANNFTGSLVSQSTKLMSSFERFWDTIVFQIIPVTTGVLAAVIILWTQFWQYSLFLFVLSVSFAIAVFLGNRIMHPRNIAEASASTAMNGYLADVVANASVVQAYAQEDTELARAMKKATTWRQKNLHVMSGFIGVSFIYSIIDVIILVAAIVFAVYASEQKLISAGLVYLALSYTSTVVRQLWEMNSIMRNYNRVMGDANDMTEILDKPIEVINMSEETLRVAKGAISFQKMKFTHDNGEGVKIFNDFSLEIPAGQRVGLVGHSGSGKTTLTKLLLRFSDIDGGTIRIDGQDIAAYSLQSLRSNIAYVPQDPMLFHRSLRENIAYGKPDATDDEIIAAAKQANAWEFIETLKDGLDTTVGERGVKLSGGQRQRIAIARALLKDAPILILDEATSALDSESEKLIQDALATLMKGRTSLVIAHRLSTVAKLDRIIVLQHGRIAEDDTHLNLLRREGVYATLWKHQSGGFIKE